MCQYFLILIVLLLENDEIRISNDEIMTNDQMINNHCNVASPFELRHLSSFKLRHFQFVSTSLDATIR